MAKVNLTKEEKEKLRKMFPKADVEVMLSHHSPLYHGNIYPIDGKTKPLLDVYFYFKDGKVFTYYEGFVWIAPEDKVYVKVMEVLTLTKGGKVKVENGMKHYFGVKK